MFKAEPDGKKALKAIIENNDKKLTDIFKHCSIEYVLKNFKSKNITIKNMKFYYKEKQINNSLTRHIVEIYRKKKPIEAFVRFFENVMKNPSDASRNELYDFMLSTKLPLTSRGTFLAYRSITSDWKDQHTRSMDNSIGKIVSMPRSAVNADRTQTCSTGLHFCGQEYNNNWIFCPPHGRLLTIVEVNPKDVVSIPTDYNNQKGRCCKFRIIDVAYSSTCLENLWYYDAAVISKHQCIWRLQHTKFGKYLKKKDLIGLTKEQLCIDWLKALEASK